MTTGQGGKGQKANGLAERIDAELHKQRQALLSGDWPALAEASQAQERLVTELAKRGFDADQRELLRRLRREADRNARLALRLREGLESRLRGRAPQVSARTYNHRGRVSSNTRSLLERRG